MPLISVIIPCYNAEKHLSNCLEALENQTFTDFNVIFIDDCSSDNTVEVLKKFAKKHSQNAKILRNEKNSGPGFSRNRGIAVADGQYIAFCDSDDWYEKEYLASMAAAAKENDADIVFCNSNKVLPNGKKICIDIVHKTEATVDTKAALLYGVDSLCMLMVKRQIIATVSQPDIRNGEDMAIIPLLIFGSKTFSIVEKPIYNYFCHSESLSRQATEKVTESLFQSFMFVYQNRKVQYEKEIEFIGIKNVVYGVLLNHYKCSKDNKKTDDILRSFESKYPNCYKNKYISTLPVYKRFFVFCAEHRFHFFLRMLSLLHKKIFSAG